MAIIIDGKAVAQQLYRELKVKTAELIAKGVTPGLAVIIVGENPASQVYVANKEKRALKMGFYSKVVRLPAETTREELLAVIDGLNADTAIDGILLQLPLPKHLDQREMLLRISPEKDVDGFHVTNAGRLFCGIDGFVPCTPKGIIRLIESTGVPIDGKNAVVLGRSLIVGKPVSMLLLGKNATVTTCHSHTANLAEHTKNADILVVAIDSPRFVTGDMIKPGAVVIDVGISRLEDGLCGDVDFESAKDVAGYITPVPGGVGPMTIAMLMENTVIAAQKRIL